ncbi:hypothetical protein T265_14004, partial [Opisthorchis viverrini]
MVLFGCNTIPVLNCYDIRRKHEGPDIARLPRQEKFRGEVRFESLTFRSVNSRTDHLSHTYFLLAGIPSEGSTKAGVLLSGLSLEWGGREAEVGFEPRTF